MAIGVMLHLVAHNYQIMPRQLDRQDGDVSFIER